MKGLRKMTKKKVVEDTRPQWEIDRDNRNIEYNNAARSLLPNQTETLKFVMKAIQDADFMLHESYELSVDDMKAIDTSEWKLRVAFPELYEHIHNERMGD